MGVAVQGTADESPGEFSPVSIKTHKTYCPVPMMMIMMVMMVMMIMMIIMMTLTILSMPKEFSVQYLILNLLHFLFKISISY